MRTLNYEKLASDIQIWIKNYLTTAGAKGIVLGLSGGIDSSVTAALSVNAIGNENVIGLGLPCESLSEDLEDAKLVASHLGIKFIICDLTSTYKELIAALPSELETNKLAKANIKPRLRMTTIYYVGQSKGNYLVGGTGNRTEIAIGYFTKYGDGGVDIEPLGALYKCEVRELAKVLKIPEKIITRPPSAGLWKGQTDEGEIGMTYDLLDEIIYRLDYNLDLDGLQKNDIQKVKEMMRQTKHKINMPPFFKIT